ncbi:Xaa-Pro peptidase family protein [bacterium]|nr:Xaa-Pro peptidase family protein [bacterium]
MFLNEERAKKIMEREGLDALVATTPENVAYLTGFWVLTSLRHRTRQVYAVISKDEMQSDMIISVGLIDHPVAEKAWVRQYFPYGEFYFATDEGNVLDEDSQRLVDALDSTRRHKNAKDALIACLEERGLAGGNVGVDQGGDAEFLPETLKERLTGLKTRPAYGIFKEIRAVKTSAEISRIRAAVKVTEKALTRAIGTIGEGVSEEDIATVFKETIVRGGGIPSLVFIGAGTRGAFPNVEPSPRKIGRGDAVRFDVGCILAAYHSDMARTAVLGSPSPKLQKYHDALMAGQGKIMEALKPGARMADLFELGVSETKKNGIAHYQRQHCGHGNGIEGYDLPLISPNNQTLLEPGMVLCIETPYYEPGFAGLQIEDIVVITSNGYERITQMERKLFVV